MSYFLTNFKETFYSQYKIIGGEFSARSRRSKFCLQNILGESCRKITYELNTTQIEVM